MTTLEEGINSFLTNIKKSRSPLTYKAYWNALLGQTNGFMVKIQGSVKPGDDIGKINEKHAMIYMQDIMDLAPATRQLHKSAVCRLYTYIAGNDWATVSLDRLNFLLQGSNVLETVKPEIVYDAEKISYFLEWVRAWTPDGNTPIRYLRALRDKAFIITLADSGLRVHEACKLKIKDLDFETAAGIIVGKGRKQARFKIGDEAIALIRFYLDQRNIVVTLAPDQPIFARHDRKAGHLRSLHMSTQTGEDIIHDMEKKATGEKTLTCHKLRHYFVTRIVKMEGNIKLAQILARHTNINITERYSHLVNNEVDAAFDRAINQ